ncbi:MAG: MATE family efflux transporter [Armatimonadota bacterium]|nr:MATE family efflux transporter [bacterium]
MEELLQLSANKHGRDMTQGSIPRHLIHFSLPMLAGNIVQTAYSIVNAIWVGKGLGKADLAAVTVSMPVVFLLMAIAIGLTMGTSILVSQFAGARNWERLRSVVQTSTVLLIGFSLALFVVGEMAMPWILRQMQTPASVYGLAAGYTRIFMISIPFVYCTFLIVSMLRGVGDSKTPLYFQIGSLILTAIFDPVLMFGWLGFPRMGLNGTAVASVLMQALGLVAMFIYLYRRDHLVAPDWLHLSVDWSTLWLIVKIGLPTVVQHSLISIGMVVVTGLVNMYGENAVAAFGAAMRIDQLAILPAMTFNAAVSTVVGQNIGAGHIHRVKSVFVWGVVLCGGMTLFASVFALTSPLILLKMFLNEPRVMDIGVVYLRVAAINYMLFAVMLMANGVINGAGHTMITTVITLVSFWLARVPLAVLFSHRMHRVEGIWYAVAISAAVGMIASLGVYFSGLWKKPVVRHGLVNETIIPSVIEPDEAI